jgi:tRNA nucleotidyltransferase (CCA-adding enzyme)
VPSQIRDYVASLGLDAYVVGGAVRDELLGVDSKDTDFLVGGVDAASLRAALEPRGKVDDLIVAGRAVGLRLYPRDPAIRKLAPAGIEFAPPRRERSTGPGRHDFEIVIDPGAPIEDDLARRDFTVNAMARSLADGVLVDPYGGRADLEGRVLRTVSPQSFAEDPLRLVRGLRFVAQLDLDPDEETIRQMRDEAPSVALVSAERIGGGLAADGMGELSKLLLAARPRKALRLARDTGVLAVVLPELGTDPEANEAMFALVQASADAGRALQLRLAALLASLDAASASRVLERLRYPNRLRERVVALVRFNPLDPGDGSPPTARRVLQQHGDDRSLDLLDLREDALNASGTGGALAELSAFRRVVESERGSPHRLAELALDGSDLIGIGYRPGPELGRTLAELLDAVVADPALNTREALLERALARLPS